MLEHWDPQKVLDTIESQRITVTAMVPTQLIRLLKLTSAERYQVDTSSLEWVLHTAAPCPEWVKRGMIDWFGPVIVELYGSSEGAGPVVCTTQEWLDHPGTVGRAVGSLRLSILDDEGNDLPAGQVGAIFAARADGPPTYFGDEEKTAAIRLPDGRFTVGDIGWLDDDEFLYLADRRVDLVIRGGANVYPAEIEGVISEHHCVADVAVFGVDDPEWGQQIVALVELVASSAPPTDAATTIEDLFEHCRQRLSSFKVPQVLDIMEKLPREASGKLKKRIVREEYLLRQSVADG
jgi:acyl-CoA synthetase (AMP-forming)/AMP-acid ligase II